MNNSNKTIIHVWTQDFIECNGYKSLNYFGFGDLLRCSIELYKLCKCMNCNFILDISLHPISQFYNINKHKYSQLIQDNKDKIYYIDYDDTIRYILNNIKNNDVLYFISNYGSSIYEPTFGETLKETQERTEYFKNIFTPNEEFMNYIKENYEKILMNNYKILHYRFNDNYLINGSKNNFDKFYKHLTDNYENDYILFCDSSEFKKYVKEKNSNIKLIDNDICHIGKSKDLKLLKHTLTEIYIISNSKYIKSYSSYEWVSGFIYHIGKLYNIPIEGYTNIKY